MIRLIVISLTVITLLLSGCGRSNAETGMLTGQVTIGPLVPVERPGDNHDIPCEVYEARKIMVYDNNHKKLIKQVDIDCDGLYQVELPPDSYVIDINRFYNSIPYGKDN